MKLIIDAKLVKTAAAGLLPILGIGFLVMTILMATRDMGCMD